MHPVRANRGGMMRKVRSGSAAIACGSQRAVQEESSP
jgi:hypothetical protein